MTKSAQAIRAGWGRAAVMAATVFLTGASALVTGCVSLPREESQPMRTFLLSQPREPDDPAAAGIRRGAPGVGVLLIGVPQAQPGFDSTRMAYMRRPYEVQYYAVNQWADPPTRMLVPLLVRALEGRGMAHAVVALPTSVRGDIRLDVDQVAMVQEFLEQPSRLRMGLRARLVKLPESTVVGSRLFDRAARSP